MRDLFFQELRNCSKAISLSEKDERDKWNEILSDTVSEILELTNIGRNQGLLALEDAVSDIKGIPNGRYLGEMFNLIVDGTEPAAVEEISTARYFAMNLAGYEALQYLVMLSGALSVQDAENPRVMEVRLLAMLPEEAVNRYRRKQEKLREEEGSDLESELKGLEQYYKGGIAALPGDEFYFPIQLADYAIRSLDDKSLQRVLGDIDNSDISLAMKGLSGEARRQMFTNMSPRLALMIAEDMEFMGPVRMKDVAGAITAIFNRIVSLIKTGEINSTDAEALCLFSTIFNVSDKEVGKRIAKDLENQLYEIMKEYDLTSHRIVNAPWKNEE